MKNRKNNGRPFGNPLQLKSESSRSLPRSAQKVQPTKKLSFKERLKRLRKRRFKFTWKKLLITLAILFGLLVLAATSVFAYYVRELPNPRKIQDRPVSQSTQIYDRNGKLLYTIHGDTNRTVVKSDQISNYVKEAVVAVEDAEFYNDHGFSVKGITRAALVRFHLLKDREGGGGSTITQQYIKNALLTQDQTASRKLKELILAVEVEQIYSKDEILTGYLNEISYSGPAYGIEAAAQTYFGKSAKDLTLSEAATLSAIPQSPSYYSPYGDHLDDLFARKDYILDRMVKVGYITQAQADQAKKDAPSADNVSFKHENIIAPHFVFYVQEKLLQTLDPDPQLAAEKLSEGGYKVTTSLDLDTQNLAQKTLSDLGPTTVKKYQATNAALTAIDPKTGEVLAMVGSIDYDNSKSGNTNFANSLLQPGSSFKPIVYATAFGPDYKYSPSSVTYDVPTDFGNYKPNNYDGKFRGAVTDRQALAGSLNIPAVKNLALVGVSNALTTAKNMGITTLNRPATDYGLSIVLGSGEVKPVEMAGAYATFANGGMNNPLRPILTIEKGGAMVKDFRTTPATKVLEPETAYEISSILSDNNARSYIFGQKNNLTLPDRPVAAKSGTTENNRDAWTIGYTPQIAVSVWVGNNDPNKTMIKGADGSYVAAPIWNQFMRQYLTGKPVVQFDRPATIKEVTVDKLSGKLPTDQSPADERLTDIFAPWQAPKDSDNIHIKVNVSKATGKLATDLTPADQIDQKIFFTIHSEQPNNPNWELPVQAWARSVYGDRVGNPPTEKDNLYTEDNRPSLTFISPKDGGVVNGTFTIEVSPQGSRPITKVDFSINNVAIGTATAAPWSITYNAASFQPGSQTIQATVTNDLGLTKSAQITVSPQADAVPPAPISGLNATNGKTGILPIRLTWTNPADSDLTSIFVYQSTDPSQIGTKIQTVPATPGSPGTLDISPPAGKYYFTLHSVDAAGNENQSPLKTSAQML